MKNFTTLFSLLLLSLIISCPKQKAYEAGFEIAEGEKRDVEVLYVAPAGGTEGLSEVNEIMVSFNQPIVPLEGLPEFEKSGPLKLTPAVKGRYRWRGTSTLFFMPDEKLPGGTRYQCRVPKGTKSLNGTVLKQDYTWEFITARTQIVYSRPYHDQEFVELDHNIYVRFNQKMSTGKAKPFIKITVEDSKGYAKNILFQVRTMNEAEIKDFGDYWKPDNVLVIDPKGNLPIQSEVSVEFKKGLPGALGEQGMEEDRTIIFNTYNYFTFQGLEYDKIDPQGPIDFIFSNPVYYQDLIEHIAFNPPIEIPEYYKNWTSSSAYPYFYLEFKPATDYQITIDKDLKDRFGNRLGQGIIVNFNTTDYMPNIQTATGRGIVESYSDRRHPITIINVNKVRKRMAIVNRNNIIPLLLDYHAFYGSQSFSPPFQYSVDETWNINPEWNKKTTVPLEFNNVLQGRPSGFIFFEIDGLKNLKYDRRYFRGFLQVTNIGITGKFASENNLIWVTTLKDAQPLPDANIELRDDKNRILWSGGTNKDGMVETPGWKQLGVTPANSWDKPRIWVFAHHGDDEAFIASNEGTGIYPYDFGISYDWEPEPERFEGYIFTERGIYKSGENVYIKGIIREKIKGKWQIPIHINNLEVRVRNSRDEEIFNKNMQLSSYGAFDIKLPIAVGAPTGWYEINAEAGDLDEYFYGSFRVEAYRPAQFEVKVKAEKNEYIFGEDFTGEINAKYLFGGPMAGEKVNWSISLCNYYYRPPGNKGYQFGAGYYYDYDEEWDFEGVIGSGEDKLNEHGKLTVNQKLTHENVKRTMSLTLEATVTAENRMTLSGRTNVLVHQGEYYIGIKPEKTFIEINKPLNFAFITTDAQGKIIAGKDLNVEIIRREWTSVRKAGVEGRYEWVTEKKDSTVAKFKVKTSNDAQTKSFTPTRTGFYVVQVSGKDNKGNQITTSTYFYATGQGYISWRRSDDDRIEIVPDNEKYAPGDVARILIKSPYEKAKALVTVEREFIMERFVRDINGSSEIIEIPLSNDHLPNVYVSVILIQGRTGTDKFDEKGNDIGKPSFKIGYANLIVDPGSKHLDLTVTTDREEYKPRDSVTIRIKVKDQNGRGQKAEVVLATVDVGVLNLIGFQTPDPFPVFYGSRPLSVQSSESRLHIIGQRSYDEKGENRGGGGGEAAAFDYRTEFLTTAYYNPTIYTDNNGDAVVKFQLPDNLTTFRIMATSHTRTSSFGAGEASIRVKKPLLILEALPRFIRLGDEFEAGIVVHNNTDQTGNVSVQAETEKIKLLSPPIQSIMVEKTQEKEVRFKYNATEVGKATFRFKVTMGSESDGIELKIPVIAPRLTEAVALYSQTEDKASEAVQVPDNIFNDIGYLEFTTSSSALVGLEGGIEYLVAYPYECLEQKTSRILPFILAEDLINSFKLSALKGRNLRKEVQTTLDEFEKFHAYNGGFKFWPDSYYSSPWLTAYVVYALAKADQKGYSVNIAMVDRAIEYLKNVLRRSDTDWEYPYNLNVQLTTKAFILHAIALWDEYDYGYLSMLYEKRDELSLFGKTLLLKAAYRHGNNNYQKELVRILLNKIKISPTTAHFEEPDETGMQWIWHSNVRTTALVLQALIETQGEFANAEKVIKWLVTERKMGRWRSTQENIYVFDAFNTYFNVYEKQKPNFTGLIYLENKEIAKEIFSGRELDMRRQELPLADLKKGVQLPVNIEKRGTGRLYYGLRMLYAPKGELKPRDEGIAVFKVIEPLVEGPTGNELSAGQLYKVTLSVVTPQERNFVVVDDPLPAGLEVVNTSFQTESKEVLKIMNQSDQGYRSEYDNDEDYYYDDYYYEDSYYQSWGTFDHYEIYDDKVLLFADALFAGEHTFSYVVRAMTYGTFTMPSTKAEEMYTPEVFGYNRQRMIVVK